MALDYSQFSGECSSELIANVFTMSLGCAFEYEGNYYVINEYLKTIYKGANEFELNNKVKELIGHKYINCITSNYGMHSYLEFEFAGGAKKRVTILNIKLISL